MIFNLNKLVSGKTHEFNYSPDFSNTELYKRHIPLLDVKNVNAQVSLLEVGDLLTLTIKGTAKVELLCSISSEHFIANQRFEETFEFSFDENDDEFDHISSGKDFDIDPYVYATLSASIPMVPVKPGAKMQQSGDGYRVLTESELLKEKEDKVDPRFAALDDIEL